MVWILRMNCAISLNLNAESFVIETPVRNAENLTEIKFMPSDTVSHPRDPLHGITLENIINQLVQRHGWGEMGHPHPHTPAVFSSIQPLVIIQSHRFCAKLLGRGKKSRTGSLLRTLK